MTYFRNAREKYDRNYKNEQTEKPNPYYEGLLSEADKNELFGYDFCKEQAENAFFNLDLYIEALSEIGFYLDKVDFSMLNKFYHSVESYEQCATDEMTIETKTLMILLECMAITLESERDMLVTSMIDEMDDEEYKKNYKAVWGKEPEDGDSDE